MTSASDYRRHEIYNHPRSKEARTKVQSSPVATLRTKHRDEKLELGQKHRRESIALEGKLNEERARDLPHHRYSPDADERRRKIDGRHKAERVSLAARQAAEMEDAMARHPLD